MADAPFRFRKLGYVAVTVPDVERSTSFYRDVVGLDVTDATNDAAYLTCSRDHHNLVFYKGQEPGLRRVAFEMETPADWQRARDHLGALGVPVKLLTDTETQRLDQGPTLRFLMPGCGVTVELYAGMTQLAADYAPKHTKILRLGHIVLSSTAVADSVKWCTENFGFKVSDVVENGVTFMRCFPNPYHHSLGIGQGAGNQLHHFAFMVAEIDDIGRALNRLRKAGSKIVFGPGRHTPSESVFLYFLDPDGITIEYTLGMEEFSEHQPRSRRVLPKKMEVIDMWGGVPGPEYAKVGRIEGALA